MELEHPVITKACQVALSYVRRSTKCPSTQDELYQRCLIKIFKVWELNPEASDRDLTNLCHRAIRNEIFDYWRAVKRKKRAHDRYIVIHRSRRSWEELHRTGADIDETRDRIFLEHVTVTAKTLPNYLAVIYDMKTKGLTNAQIATETHQSLRTVGNRLQELKAFFTDGFESSQEK